MRTRKEPTSKEFTTLDAYLAGFLTLHGHTPELIEEGPKIVFAFPSTENLFKYINDYNNGALVEANRLVLAVKTLKSQIYAMKMKKGSNYRGGERTR